MKALLEFVELAEVMDLEKQTNLIERDLSHIIAAHRDNPVTKFPEEEINTKFEEALKRLQAARHGLGLANKLRNPEDRKKNKSRIMSNLNIIRLIVQQIEQQLTKENQAVLGNKEGFPHPDAGDFTNEDVEPKSKTGIKKEVKDVVKDEKVAQRELEKNPFNKNKKTTKKK